MAFSLVHVVVLRTGCRVSSFLHHDIDHRDRAEGTFLLPHSWSPQRASRYILPCRGSPLYAAARRGRKMTFCLPHLPADSLSLADTFGSAFKPLWQSLDCATQVRSAAQSLHPPLSLMQHNIPYAVC